MNVGFYSSLYRDITPRNAKEHWSTIGERAGRIGSREQFYQQYPDFKWSDYVKEHPQTREMQQDCWELRAISHFLHIQEHQQTNNTKIIKTTPVVHDSFDWQFYVSHYEDLQRNGIATQKLATAHWLMHGKREGRLGMPPPANRDHLVPTQIANNKTVGIFLTLFYEELQLPILEYMTRLPFPCTVYLSSRHVLDTFVSSLHHLGHTVVRLSPTNYGMDIGDFVSHVKTLRDQNVRHDYYLKIHSKRADSWRNGMMDNLLPTHDYQTLFDLIDECHFTSPEVYTYPVGHSLVNKNTIHDHMSRNGLSISALFAEPARGSLSISDYYHYNSDMKTHTRWLFNNGLHNVWSQYLTAHYNKFDSEETRIHCKPIRDCNYNYCFSAGTMFWYDQHYVNYLIDNSDDLDLMISNLSNETGVLINNTPTYTHMLEYWFGLIACHLNKKKYRTLRSINFLFPPLGDDTASSGGFRTLIRQIASLQKQGWFVTIQICSCPEHLKKDQQRFIQAYDLIPYFDRVRFVSDREDILADVHVATGWQTFAKAQHYEFQQQLVCFFCQDLEWEFLEVEMGGHEKVERIKKFYNEYRPTFTMSKFLHHKIKQLQHGPVVSTILNVDNNIYNIVSSKKDRHGVCIYHSSIKKHRLPQVTIELTHRLRRYDKNVPVYIIGDISEEHRFLMDKNTHILGTLNVQQLQELYNKCKIGVCISTTNPSRIGFEMSACGCVCVEISCEYTEHDLDKNMFMLTNPDTDSIYGSIVQLIVDHDLYDEKYSRCVNYSAGLSKQITEETLFQDMIEDVIYS